MTDDKLIQMANDLDNQDWAGAYKLAAQAKSEDTRREIEKIARAYYHNEEYYND